MIHLFPVFPLVPGTRSFPTCSRVPHLIGGNTCGNTSRNAKAAVGERLAPNWGSSPDDGADILLPVTRFGLKKPLISSANITETKGRPVVNA
jgi:hypothetical protein